MLEEAFWIYIHEHEWCVVSCEVHDGPNDAEQVHI